MNAKSENIKWRDKESEPEPEPVLDCITGEIEALPLLQVLIRKCGARMKIEDLFAILSFQL